MSNIGTTQPPARNLPPVPIDGQYRLQVRKEFSCFQTLCEAQDAGEAACREIGMSIGRWHMYFEGELSLLTRAGKATEISVKDIS